MSLEVIRRIFEPLRILGLLIYKSLLIRKRHWAWTIFCEILIPVGFIYLSRFESSPEKHAPPDENPEMDSHYPAQSSETLMTEARGNTWLHGIIFAPRNSFTEKLMKNVRDCINPTANIKSFQKESDFIAYYKKKSWFDGGLAVIFDEAVDETTKSLNYKIRIQGSVDTLYNSRSEPMNVTAYYTVAYSFAQTQICVDRSFVSIKSGGKPIPDMYIQRMPYPAVHTDEMSMSQKLQEQVSGTLIRVFLWPLLIESARVLSEKTSGINVLMAMNGISNTKNLLSWAISGVMFIGICSVLPMVFFLTTSSSSSLAFMHYGNPLILFIVLISYLGHLLTFGIHVTAYFSKTWIMIIVLWVAYDVGVYLRASAFTDSTLHLVPYVGLIFPNILLHDEMLEIGIYETRTEGIQWYNLFIGADPLSKVGGSVGMFWIFSIIGMIIHFLLAIYIYAIKPGKYGVAKHPLYFLKFEKKKDGLLEIEILNYDEMSDKRFESIPVGVYAPGIQIRNLNKAFNVSLFSKQKVHALQNVSIDFYKGQITALLGHNGAGKTTMMSILTGMMSPTDGLVLINSKNLKKNASEILNHMGLCPQENMCFSSLSVSEQLLFFAMVKRKDKSLAEIKKDVNDLLQKVEMFDKRNVVPKKLSGGQKRRLCLCMALVGDSSTLILDEPTSGLDPESRRVIWNILLKMRGQKTILISTHNMEEANILGDRIAILHGGQLKTYGTSLFLKRMIGQNKVEVTCSIVPRSDIEKIRSELHKEGIITQREAGKIVVSIPNSPGLPDSLDNLEKKKKELGVTGFSVSLISLEQVFLKVTEENEEGKKSSEITDRDVEKLTGIAFFIQTVRALFSKNLTYALKNYSTIIGKVTMIFVTLLLTVMIWEGTEYQQQHENELVPINLNMYQIPEVLYTNSDKSLSNQYKTVVQNLGGKAIEVTDTHLDNALMRRAKENLVLYDNYLIAAAEFNKSLVNAFYSETAIYSLPISINLLSNTILQNILGSGYSIKLFSHALPSLTNLFEDLSFATGLSTAFMFSMMFSAAVAIFVIHPSTEITTDVKHLQKMAGVSGLTYWGTMFLFDLMEYMMLVLILIIGFLIADLSLGRKLFGPTEIFLEILLLLLFGINALLLIYICSTLIKKTNVLLRLLIFIPIVLMILELMAIALLKPSFRRIQKTIFLMLPYTSLLHSQTAFFGTAETNARCRRLPNKFYDLWCKEAGWDICCVSQCYDGKCKITQKFFNDNNPMFSLKTSTMFLCVTPILYIAILALIESRFLSKCTKSKTRVESNSDEQVEQEKKMIFERIQTLRGNTPTSVNNNGTSEESIQNTENQIFLVYELRKSYSFVKAVKDVSFGVYPRQCFGLLGVNGAGKSTTFRMMTGGEIPDHGIMYLNDKDFRKKEKYFLSQMGYCPQHDAMLESLNSYDHLRLFARLRGIPEKHVENEVQAWIENLNLVACASRPSGTYSGGNKRRLNIAMSLIGNPSLVLMDEPTTGVDPGARRSLWNVIKDCQMAGQSVVLTSHSMEECEALCNRLAIMVDGKLVCIGASEQLKQRFGAGYDIQIRMDIEKAKDQVDNIKEDMPRLLNCELTDEKLGNLMFHVSPSGTTWRKMYDMMYEMKKKYDCIDDFLVLSASLEQLFLMFARTSSASPSPQRNR